MQTPAAQPSIASSEAARPRMTLEEMRTLLEESKKMRVEHDKYFAELRERLNGYEREIMGGEGQTS